MHRSTPKRWLEFLALLLTAAGGCEEVIPVTASCDVRVEHHETQLYYHERIDLLFVLDDSPSMAQERQHFLELQLPRAMQLLLHGAVPGTQLNLVPMRNLHVGVISSDMGVGAEGIVAGCSPSGDDGRLLNAGKCQASEPGFAWYYENKHDLDATEAAIECLADVGNTGCQVSQPLEAALKALWPAGSADSRNDLPVPSDDFRFRDGSQGHGLESNARFLRSQGALSLIIVIILTDQDDCSTHDPSAFTSDPSQPLSGTAAALGCVRDPAKLRAVQTYVNGVKALRPGNEQMLSVGIIAGVPPEWVSSVLEPARLHSFDEPQLLRDAFDSLLSDPRMQPVADDPRPSCSSATATATAPRRLMQFARNLDHAARVRSICDYDLAEMFFEMLDSGGHSLSGPATFCAHLPLVPDGRGLLPCRVTWELPRHADPEEPLTPVSCAELPDLLTEPSSGFPTRSERGRVLCEMRQAPVQLSADGSLQPQGEGFFHVLDQPCWSEGQRIQFTKHAQLPRGVTASIECLDPTQRAPAEEPGRPAIGDVCLRPETRASSDELCGNADGDHGPGKLFCSPDTNHCVLGCELDSECPADWACEKTARICVRPGCE